jgi:tetratricopeptide (TPR) repeat protein
MAIESSRLAIDRWRELLGVDSTREAYAWHNLCLAYHQAGKFDDALAAAREAVRIREARFGDSIPLSVSLVAQAGMLVQLGRWAEAVAIYDRAIGVFRAKLRPGDVTIGPSLINRSIGLAQLHRFDDAQRDLDEVIALYDRASSKSLSLPHALSNRGDLAAMRGRCQDALRDHARSIELLEQRVEPTASDLIYPLSGKGACLVRLGRPAEAIPLLQRALRCKANGVEDFELARVKAYLGRALVETRRDTSGGRAMARAARAGIASSPNGADELRLLDRWLAAHPR